MSRSEAFACRVLFQPNAKVIRVADVKTRVCFRAKDINVVHAAVLVTLLARKRSFYVPDFCVAARARFQPLLNG